MSDFKFGQAVVWFWSVGLPKRGVVVLGNFEIGLLDKELVENLSFVKVKCQGLAVFLF